MKIFLSFIRNSVRFVKKKKKLHNSSLDFQFILFFWKRQRLEISINLAEFKPNFRKVASLNIIDPSLSQAKSGQKTQILFLICSSPSHFAALFPMSKSIRSVAIRLLPMKVAFCTFIRTTKNFPAIYCENIADISVKTGTVPCRIAASMFCFVETRFNPGWYSISFPNCQLIWQ